MGDKYHNVQHAIILCPGLEWKHAIFSDIKADDIFIYLRDDGEISLPCIARRNPSGGVLLASTLFGLEKSTVTAIYETSLAAGCTHKAIVRSLLALRNQPTESIFERFYDSVKSFNARDNLPWWSPVVAFMLVLAFGLGYSTGVEVGRTWDHEQQRYSDREVLPDRD